MIIPVSVKASIVSIGIMLLMTTPTIAQKKTRINHYKSLPPEIQHINSYFNNYPPQTFSDSTYFDAFHYLMDLSVNDTLRAHVNHIQHLLDENRSNQELVNLFKLKKNVDSINLIRSKYLAGFWQYKEWLRTPDSLKTSIYDSTITSRVDSLTYLDSITVNFRINELSVYNDSLAQSIDKTIAYFAQNEVLRWINQTRRDTVSFYIVNIDNDSLLVRLYNNSPEMVRFSITDYWGTNIKAVIRDINKNSMKILVQDTPELDYQTDKKAKEAFENMGNKDGDGKNLTVTVRPLQKEKIKWRKYGNTNFDISQVHFSESWAKGGESSLSFMAGMELNAIYKTIHYTFENKGVFKYGAMKQSKSDYLKSTEDRMEFGTKYGHKLFGNYYLSAVGTFRSQFAPCYEYPNNVKGDMVSKFLNPAYITFAVGLDFKPNDKSNLFVSPISSKTTIVKDTAIDQTKYGLNANETVRHEMGAIVRVNYKRKVWGNIEMENNLELFSNYVHNPQNVDVDWEFKLLLPVNNYIRFTISTRLIYDDDMDVPKKDGGTTKAIQFKELLTIGLAVKF